MEFSQSLKDQHREIMEIREEMAVVAESSEPGAALPARLDGVDTGSWAVRWSLNPKQIRFVIQYILNGGNASRAARAVGYNPDWGWHLVRKNAAIQAAIDEAGGELANGLRDWGKLMRRAQDTLEELLTSDDERIRLAAAERLLDRGEGKPVQKIVAQGEVEHRVRVDDEDLRLAIALVAARRWGLAQSIEYVRKHRSEVQSWVVGSDEPVRLPAGLDGRQAE